MKTLTRFAAGCCAVALASSALANFGASSSERESVPPGVSRYVAPVFPEMTKQRGITRGHALIAIAWDAAGAPADVLALTATDPSFGEVSVEAAQKWRRPPGRAEVVTYRLNYAVGGVIIVAAKMISAYNAELAADQPPRVWMAEDLDREPKPIVAPMPPFPESARGRFDGGRVVVEFFVDEEGQVRAPTVNYSSSEEFAAAALATLRQWRFETPRRHGQPAVSSMRWAFDFKKT